MAESVVRGSLDRLAELSLLRSSDAESGISPVSPQIGLEMLIASQQAEVSRMQQAVEESRAAVARFVAEHSSADQARKAAGVERLSGVDEVRLRLEELSAEISSETSSLAPGGPQSTSNREASRLITATLLARGIVVRTVYLDSVSNDPASLEHVTWLHQAGGEVRTAPTLPLRVQLIDRRIALLPLDPADSSRGAVLAVEPGIVAAVQTLFDTIWESARPLDSEPEPSQKPTARELAVLKMLSQGMTDEAIARKLAVSLRTERRIVSDLMAVLGAQTRFQLGQQAVRHGYL
ncbi:helix-turn-helix domain-containing protein [Streptomyces triticirhizae]|uniref:helix-turn-helix domain-containing protein n=1 Tax=Streptomyces triticirhizae TaxID=2483353 RepID=UPI001F2E1D51|nr:helix-turn-helix transcriptional regulator [Streptomyces triticirhizae]